MSVHSFRLVVGKSDRLSYVEVSKDLFKGVFPPLITQPLNDSFQKVVISTCSPFPDVILAGSLIIERLWVSKLFEHFLKTN